MAKEAIKNLEEQLNCSICLDNYTDPKLLQCFHVHCRQCLVRLVVRDQQGKLGLTCPTCRQVTPVPDRGVAGLQPAFHINNLVQIKMSLQTLENQEGIAVGSHNGPQSPTSSAAFRNCIDHTEEQLKLYCETCGELVCLQCIMKNGWHHDHECALLANAFEDYKKEVTSLLCPIEEKVEALKNALAAFEHRSGEITDQRVVLKDRIQANFARLREILDDREKKLCSELDQTADGKLKSLEKQKNQVGLTLAELSDGLHSVRESIHTPSKEEALTLKMKMTKKAEELKAPLPEDFLEPDVEANMTFSASPELATQCQEYGQILAQGIPDPSKCRTTGKSVAVVGEKSTNLVEVNTAKGTPCEGLFQSLECEFVSEITGSRASCSVERRGQGQYEISYQPTVKGRHQLHIRIEGQHIKGSPHSVAVTSLIERLGEPIKTIEGVRGPLGVTISHLEELIVTEWGRDRVSVLGPKGKIIRSFGKYGLDNGQFQGPRGVAVDAEGNILVTDGGNCRVQKFTSKGQFLESVGAKGIGPLKFSFPSGIAFNADVEKVYVGDQNNNSIQVLNSDLTFSSFFGSEGSGKGQFRSPHGIVCDSNGKVYVADTDNCRIQVFTAEGEFLRMFGRRGQCRGELERPVDVAVDGSDIVYVSDCGHDRISVFTADGCFLTSFVRKGKGLGENMQPRGLTVDSCGVVYVCDHYNHCLQRF